MADLFETLAAQAIGDFDSLRPRLPTRFEPVEDGPDWEATTEFEPETLGTAHGQARRMLVHNLGENVVAGENEEAALSSAPSDQSTPSRTPFDPASDSARIRGEPPPLEELGQPLQATFDGRERPSTGAAEEAKAPPRATARPPAGHHVEPRSEDAPSAPEDATTPTVEPMIAGDIRVRQSPTALRATTVRRSMIARRSPSRADTRGSLHVERVELVDPAEDRSEVSPPQITISIGRVEIRAASSAEPARQKPPRPRPQPRQSLDDYLRQSKGVRK